MAWPKRIAYSSERAFSMGMLHDSHRKFVEDREDALRFSDGERFACGFVLPDFQREAVWEQARSVAFVERAILGHHLSVYVYNNAKDFPLSVLPDGREVWKFDNWLIDGQQRLTALDEYWSDKFPVYDLYWSEVSERDRRRFLSLPFPAVELRLDDYDMLRDEYFVFNRGGVSHTEEELPLARR